MTRRVVVTGLGAITPLGLDMATTWARLQAGDSGIGLIDREEVSTFACRIAGLVRGFVPEEWVNPREAAYMDGAMHYGIAAAKQALADSGLLESGLSRERIGCNLSTGGGGLSVLLRGNETLQKSGPRRVSPLVVPFTLCDMVSGYVSQEHGLQGPTHCVVSACASSADALGIAFDLIRHGRADAMLTGGTDTFIPVMLASFISARAVTTTGNESPTTASRPFDKTRSGFVPSEGAVALLLEEREHARARGATIYGEVLGYGASSDAYHISAPHPEGKGAERAMCLALADAQLAPEAIGYVNAHGTSTVQGDSSEAKAIRRVFPSGLVPVSSTKSATGHLVGAAGALEAAVTLLALRDGVLPPTLNYQTPDPECDIPVIANQALSVRVPFALSNSFGFGGHCVSLAFGQA